MAGGSGERFWPLSRQTRPKQLLSLLQESTLLEDTVRRLDGMVPADRVLVLTNAVQETGVREVLPGLPSQNIIAEPAKRDTAPAIALATGWAAARDPEAVLIVLPSDALIEGVPAFQADLMTAVKAARQTGGILTLGIAPTWACPGYGYIEQGDPLEAFDGRVHEVLRFTEKPDPQTAEQFLQAGNFRWNAGMFIFQVETMLQELERQVPDLGDFARQIANGGNLKPLIDQRFAQLTKISIDFAVMEKARRVLMAESHFQWDDIGGWMSVAQYLDKDENGNAVKGARTTFEAQNNVIYNASRGVHVGLLGVQDLIVVQTDDSVLVCHRDHAEKIKKLVAQLPPELC